MRIHVVGEHPLRVAFRNMSKAEAKEITSNSRNIVDKMRMRRIVELYDALDPGKAIL